MITIERYIAVCWPFHARRMLRTTIAVYQVLIVFGFALILNVPRWIESLEYNTEIAIDPEFGWDSVSIWHLNFERKTHASGLLRDRFYRQVYHGWIWTGVMYFLPLIALAFFNFNIIREVNRNNLSCTACSKSIRHPLFMFVAYSRKSDLVYKVFWCNY